MMTTPQTAKLTASEVNECLLVGGSCGMAVVAALKVAEEAGPDALVVVEPGLTSGTEPRVRHHRAAF